MNGAVRAYLVSQGYKLTALTLSEEGGSSIPANVPLIAPTLIDMFQGNNLKLVAGKAREVNSQRSSVSLCMLYCSMTIRYAHIMKGHCMGCTTIHHPGVRKFSCCNAFRKLVTVAGSSIDNFNHFKSFSNIVITKFTCIKTMRNASRSAALCQALFPHSSIFVSVFPCTRTDGHFNA